MAAVGRRCLQVLVLIEAETQTRQEARPAPDYEAGNLAGPALKLGINNNKQQRQPWQLGGPGLQPAAQRSANATRREARRGERRLATSCNKLPHRRANCRAGAEAEAETGAEAADDAGPCAWPSRRGVL